MDEIEYRLSSGNPAIITEALGKIVKSVIDKKGTDLKDLRELKLLKEKCNSESHFISQAACKSIVYLVDSDAMELGFAMSTLISLLPNTRTYGGLISSISDLLRLDLKRKIDLKCSYESVFTIKEPQHPLITILEKNPATIVNVLSEVSLICNDADNQIKLWSLELLRPVFMWILCYSDNCTILRYSNDATELLLLHDSNILTNTLLREVLCWQQISDVPKLSKMFDIFRYVTQWYLRNNDNQLSTLFPILSRISGLQVLHGCDPRCTYDLMRHCIDQKNCDLNFSIDWVITSLAYNVVESPSSYLISLLNLCKTILSKATCNLLSLMILKASLLQWLCYGTSMTLDAMELAASIIAQIDDRIGCKSISKNYVFPQPSQLYQYFDERTNYIVELHKSWSLIGHSYDKLTPWLDGIFSSNLSLQRDAFLPLMGMLIVHMDQPPVIILKIALSIIETDHQKATMLLPVLLNCVMETRRPQFMMEWLKGIVKTSISKVNTPLIIFTLTNLYKNGGIDLASMIHLLTILEDIQPRTYTYLQEYLLEKKTEGNPDALWETEIAKAASIKRVCEKRAAEHGPEFISILSQILNRCADDNGDVASGLVLESLGILWMEHIVSPVSTWSALAPKLAKDKRPVVQVSLCKLLSNIPSLKSNTPEYDAFSFEALTTLWHLSAESDDESVIIAALNAISQFSLEDMHLKQIPDLYKSGLVYTSKDDPNAKPEDVLDYIPCEIWSTIFRYMNHNALKGLIDLCSSLVRREVNDYRSGVYQTEREDGEPNTVKMARNDSVVKGLMEFIKTETITPLPKYEDVVILAVLECLSASYSKPLPPFNWCFLQQLFHRSDVFRIPSLLIGAKQAVISGTSKRFVENFLSEFEPMNSEVSLMQDLMQSLPQLGATISPQYIVGLVEKSMKYAYIEDKTNPKEALFSKLLKHLWNAFASEKMSPPNGSAIIVLIQDLYPKIGVNSEVWEPFGDLCTQLPIETINTLTSASNWFDFSKDLLRKSTYIRCKLAADHRSEQPLNWLSEVIDNVLNVPIEHASTLHQICPALLKVKSENTSTLHWILQLISRAQEVISKNDTNQWSVIFLCDTFIMCVLLLSSRHVLTDCDIKTLCIKKEQRFSLFPNAVPILISQQRPKEWQAASGQIIEWLHYARHQRSIPIAYRKVFYNALLSCRNCPYSGYPSVRSKMLSVRYE